MDYYKIAYGYISGVNKEMGKEEEHRIFIDDDDVKHWSCSSGYCYPTPDLMLTADDLKCIREMERDLLFIAIDMDRLHLKHTFLK